MKVSAVNSNINADSYSFYNSASRVNSAERIKEAQKAAGSQNSQEVSADSEVKSSAIYQRDDYSGPNETLVAVDSKYSKQMLNGTEAAKAKNVEGTIADVSDKTMERLASKLVDKMPQIVKDIMNLGDTARAANQKVVISEDANKDYLERQAQNAQLQDISLQQTV